MSHNRELLNVLSVGTGDDSLHKRINEVKRVFSDVKHFFKTYVRPYSKSDDFINLQRTLEWYRESANRFNQAIHKIDFQELFNAFGDRILEVPQREIVRLSSLEKSTYKRLL